MWTGNLQMHFGRFRFVFDGFFIAGWIVDFCLAFRAFIAFLSLGFFAGIFCFFRFRFIVAVFWFRFVVFVSNAKTFN